MKTTNKQPSRLKALLSIINSKIAGLFGRKKKADPVTVPAFSEAALQSVTNYHPSLLFVLSNEDERMTCPDCQRNTYRPYVFAIALLPVPTHFGRCDDDACGFTFSPYTSGYAESFNDFRNGKPYPEAMNRMDKTLDDQLAIALLNEATRRRSLN